MTMLYILVYKYNQIEDYRAIPYRMIEMTDFMGRHSEPGVDFISIGSRPVGISISRKEIFCVGNILPVLVT